MTLQSVLAQFEALGDAATRASNKKHGAGDRQFGVRLGDIRKIAKGLKADHELALALWESGFLEARLVAILLFMPKNLTIEEMNRMVRAANVTQIADWFNSYVARNHPAGEVLRRKWMTAKDPWTARAGWSLTSGRIARDPDALDSSALLDRIEAEMSSAAPEVRWAMNSCLAGIGIHVPALRGRAIAIGERLGMYRDYPVAKGCTSPFAPDWIRGTVRRQGS
jgi:3-methyladenine DNA glycosylase AlkD